MKQLWLMMGVLLAITVLPVSGQDDTTFTWPPYDFTVEIPDGWVAQGQESWLVLGLPEDVNAILAGEPATGFVVEVRIIPPAIQDEAALEAYAFHNSPAATMQQFGATSWLVAELPPLDDRQSSLIRVAETYLLTATAPVGLWPEVTAQLDRLVASIDASPYEPPVDEMLVQTVTWREVQLTTPEDWRLNAVGADNLYLLTSAINRLDFQQTFELAGLWMIIRDYSEVRSMLTPESLSALRTNFLVLSEPVFEPAETLDIPGFDAYRAGFTDTVNDNAGAAVLLLTPGSAYLILGITDTGRWEASERELFDAILGTVSHH